MGLDYMMWECGEDSIWPMAVPFPSVYGGLLFSCWILPDPLAKAQEGWSCWVLQRSWGGRLRPPHLHLSTPLAFRPESFLLLPDAEGTCGMPPVKSYLFSKCSYYVQTPYILFFASKTVWNLETPFLNAAGLSK